MFPLLKVRTVSSLISCLRFVGGHRISSSRNSSCLLQWHVPGFVLAEQQVQTSRRQGYLRHFLILRRISLLGVHFILCGAVILLFVVIFLFRFVRCERKNESKSGWLVGFSSQLMNIYTRRYHDTV